METVEARALVREVLERGRLLQVASQAALGPRVVSVWFAPDDEDRLILATTPQSAHAQEWAADPRCGGTVVGVEPEGLGQKVEAISLFGTVGPVPAQRRHAAYETYRARWPQVVDLLPIEALDQGTARMALYQVEVREWVVFSNLRHPDAPRLVLPG